MNMTPKQLVEWGIEQGLIKRMTVTAEKHDRTSASREYMRCWRDQLKAGGKKRVTQPHPELKGLPVKEYGRRYRALRKKAIAEMVL